MTPGLIIGLTGLILFTASIGAIILHASGDRTDKLSQDLTDISGAGGGELFNHDRSIIDAQP